MPLKLRPILMIAAVLLAAFFTWYFSALVIYLGVSLILSLIGQPLVRMYHKIKIGRWTAGKGLAAALTLITMYLVISFVFALLIPLIISEAKMISSVDIDLLTQSMQRQLQSVNRFYDSVNPDATVDFQTYLKNKITSLVSVIKVQDLFSSVTGIISSVFVAFFAVSFITFFFLKDERMAYEAMMIVTPSRHIEAVKNILSTSKQLLTRYFIGICVDSLVVGILVTVGLLILGIPNAFIIGFFAGILNVIPYVGPWIAASLAIVIGVSSSLATGFSGLLPLTGQVLLVFITVQLLDGLLLQPYIFSNTVKAHPLEVFIVTMIAAGLGGVAGMIIAIPAYTVIRIVAKEFFRHFKLVRKLTEKLD